MTNNFVFTFSAESTGQDDVDDTDFPSCSVSKVGRGRLTKDFEDCGEKCQQSKIRKLRISHSQAFFSEPAYHTEAFSADVALSIFIQAKLSRLQYDESKKHCYARAMKVAETLLEVPLQECHGRPPSCHAIDTPVTNEETDLAPRRKTTGAQRIPENIEAVRALVVRGSTRSQGNTQQY
ncbi:hypothetical protein Trydic_g3977 [Trypoxylus dichotomus]